MNDKQDGLAAATNLEETKGGSYFVSNYPTFSFWSPEHCQEAIDAIDRAPEPGTPLGVYLHIPFCRKRCHFCYYKVYTDKSSSEIRNYLDHLRMEIALYAERPFIGGRKPKFIYFGGGTPSFLSPHQLLTMVEELKAVLPWDEAEEVTFECEPGTLTEKKLEAIREIGVTRLSLGIENFDDKILEFNGRAHHSEEIHRAYDFARSINFPQINIDLIAGMVGETDDNWLRCIEKTLEMSPDSVTIYQMEIPFNTTIYKEMKATGEEVAPVADWETKRRWVREGFSELEKNGYTIGSAYTAVKNPSATRFVYRDSLWQGADMIALGVSSFSHIGGVHFQNQKDNGPYFESLDKGELPIFRAYSLAEEESLVREFILQLKLGKVSSGSFQDKFGVDIHNRFDEPLRKLEGGGFLEVNPEGVRLTREGLLRIDSLLPAFFLDRHQSV